MDNELLPYRNKANGLIGDLTAEQAALFPEMVELVGAPSAPASTPVPSPASVASAPVLPVIPAPVGPDVAADPASKGI